MSILVKLIKKEGTSRLHQFNRLNMSCTLIYPLHAVNLRVDCQSVSWMKYPVTLFYYPILFPKTHSHEARFVDHNYVMRFLNTRRELHHPRRSSLRFFTGLHVFGRNQLLAGLLTGHRQAEAGGVASSEPAQARLRRRPRWVIATR